jgi:hypothetical protein
VRVNSACRHTTLKLDGNAMTHMNKAQTEGLVTCCRFTTRVTGTHSGTLKFNSKEYKATGKVVQVRRVVGCAVTS